MPRRQLEFGSLPAELVSELHDRAERIKGALSRGLRDAGRELIEAKAQLEHGQFVDWLQREVGMTPRTAQHLMSAYRLVEKNENFSLLSRSALFVLAGSNVAPATRAVVSRTVEEGRVPKFIEVRCIVEQAKREGPQVAKVTITTIEPPPKAGIVDLAAVHVVSAPINKRLAESKERLRAFHGPAAVATLAEEVASVVDTHTLRRLLTLCRAAPAASLADLRTRSNCFSRPTI